jgi:hypothetical protein
MKRKPARSGPPPSVDYSPVLNPNGTRPEVRDDQLSPAEFARRQAVIEEAKDYATTNYGNLKGYFEGAPPQPRKRSKAERDAEILRLRADRMPVKVIAKRFGMSDSAVRQVVRRKGPRTKK